METVKVKLTPELEARLKLYTAIKPVETFEYTPDIFKDAYPKELQPVFSCKAIKTTSLMDNEASSMGGVKVHIFRTGVKSWTNPSNVLGADFKAEYLKNGQLTDEAICLFQPVLISDVALEINSKSTLSVNEEISL